MKLISTSIQNLAYTLTESNSKVYYARYKKDGLRKVVRLGTNYQIAKQKLNDLKLDLTIDTQMPVIKTDDIVEVLKDRIDQDYTITKKTGITYKELFYEFAQTETQSQSQRQLKEKIAKHENTIFNIFLPSGERFCDMDLSDIKYSDCQFVVNQILENYKPKTAKNYKSAMSTVFNFALKQQYTKYNLMVLATLPSFDNKRIMTLTKQDIQNLYNAIITTRDECFRLIFLFGFHGRRLGEILSLEVNQFDLLNKTYSIPPQKNKSRKWFKHEMTDILYDEVSNYIKRYKPENFLFINPATSRPYSDMRKQFARLKHSANITSQFDFHQFRHLLATTAVNELNFTLEKVQSALQHSSVSVTQIYRDDNPKSSKEVTEALIAYAMA
jgi:integrase